MKDKEVVDMFFDMRSQTEGLNTFTFTMVSLSVIKLY
jgi:hypothetical protein